MQIWAKDYTEIYHKMHLNMYHFNRHFSCYEHNKRHCSNTKQRYRQLIQTQKGE